jgi:hypothetical protein
MLRTKKLIVWSLLAIPVLVLAVNLSLAKKPVPPPPPPQVKYQVSFIPFPSDGEFQGEYGWTGGMDRFGHVVVGKFRFPFSHDRAFLYYLEHPDIIDMHGWFFDANGDPLGAIPPSYPPGYHLTSGDDVSDEMVVVGTLKHEESGESRGYAIDLTIWPPVLDLLPTAGWSVSSPKKINENGDILIAGESGAFLFNPGIYNGDPDERALRTEPRDFSDDDVLILPLCGGDYLPGSHQLNNPDEDGPAQIAGKTADDFAFRYRINDTDPKPFYFQVERVNGLNDDGIFCGRALLPLGSTKPRKEEIFRYDDSKEDKVELLPGHIKFLGRYVCDMNSSQDLVTYFQVYRDNWGGWVNLDDLVIGDDTDLARWYGSNLLRTPRISDRISVTNGIDTAEAGIIVGGEESYDDKANLVILTPVVWP